MAKYATSEEVYECPYCGLECAIAQMRTDRPKSPLPIRHICPRCGETAFLEDKDCPGHYYQAGIGIYMQG